MNYFKRAATLSAPLVLLAAFGLNTQAPAQTREIQGQGDLLDRVAAVVNDGVVLESDVDDQLAALKERLRGQCLR